MRHGRLERPFAAGHRTGRLATKAGVSHGLLAVENQLAAADGRSNHSRGCNRDPSCDRGRGFGCGLAARPLVVRRACSDHRCSAGGCGMTDQPPIAHCTSATSSTASRPAVAMRISGEFTAWGRGVVACVQFSTARASSRLKSTARSRRVLRVLAVSRFSAPSASSCGRSSRLRTSLRWRATASAPPSPNSGGLGRATPSPGLPSILKSPAARPRLRASSSAPRCASSRSSEFARRCCAAPDHRPDGPAASLTGGHKASAGMCRRARPSAPRKAIQFGGAFSRARLQRVRAGSP